VTPLPPESAREKLANAVLVLGSADVLGTYRVLPTASYDRALALLRDAIAQCDAAAVTTQVHA
jgi:hypothetical protein